MAPSDNERFSSARLLEVCDGDKGFEEEILEMFKDSFNESLEKLKTALDASDEKNAVLYSHDIKGSSANVGAEVVRAVAAKMEDLARAGNLKEAQTHFDTLASEGTEVFRLLDAYLKRDG